MPHRFQSIKDRGGLKIHLDETKPIHRGFGYKTYRILRLAQLNVTNRAKAFNVTFDTMKDWDANDDREQAKRGAKADKEVDKLKDV